MASATYLSYLARCHLRGAAPLPKAEYTLLKQSVEQLPEQCRFRDPVAFSESSDAGFRLRRHATGDEGELRHARDLLKGSVRLPILPSSPLLLSKECDLRG